MYLFPALLAAGLVLYGLVRHILAAKRLRQKAVLRGCGTLPEYPHADPFLGLDLAVQTWRDFHAGSLSEGMRKRHERYGRTFRSNNLGSKCIYTVDPANILTITTSKFDDYGKSAWVGEASKHIGNGVLMSEGEAWKQSRIRLRPIFSKMMLDETKLVEPHFERLRKQLGHQRGTIVDFQELSTRLILDIATDFLFGKSTESLNEDANGQGRHFLSLVRQFEPASGSFIAVGVLAWIELLPFYRQLLHVVDGMKTFFYAQLQAVLSDTSRRSNGTSCFRTMMKDNVPVQQVQAELQNIFFASFDTTNALLCNVVEIVSKRQDIQDRLRDEISCLQGALPTRRDVQNLTYLRFVILEGKSTNSSPNLFIVQDFLTSQML